VDWLFIRMCFVLYNIENEGLRVDIINTLAEVLRMWEEANPKTWNDLQKSIETVKSFVSCILVSLLKTDGSNSPRSGFRKVDESSFFQILFYCTSHKRNV
jgi:hypothetical protein